MKNKAIYVYENYKSINDDMTAYKCILKDMNNYNTCVKQLYKSLYNCEQYVNMYEHI